MCFTEKMNGEIGKKGGKMEKWKKNFEVKNYLVEIKKIKRNYFFE